MPTKSKEEFNQFSRQYLLPQLKRLEKRRRHLFIRIPLLCLTVIALLILPIKFSNVDIPLIYLPGIIAFIFLIFSCHEYLIKYPADFKNTVTRKILAFIHPSLTYSSRSCIAKSDFIKSNLFESHIERYDGSDLIHGKIDQTDIQLSFITANRSKDDNESGIFRGLFMVIDMNKDFQGQTLVYPNYAEKYLGSMGKILNRMALTANEQIQMENPEFNRAFLVHSNNPIEARYILTPNLMERLLMLCDQHQQPLCFSFTDSKVYIAMKNPYNRINPGILSNMTDVDTCCDYFEELQKIINIVDDLNLNTRIWSKE